MCSADHLPALRTIFNWLSTKEDFLHQYTRAKEESADALTDEMLDIADDGEHIQRSRLRIETRKWLSSKLKPKKYGDKITTEHAGSLGLTDMSEETLDARLAELLKSQ